MLEDLTTGAVAGGCVALLIRHGSLRRARTLDAKLHELRRLTGLLGLFLLLFAIGVVAQGHPTVPALPAPLEGNALGRWLVDHADQVRQRQARNTWIALAPVALLLAFLPSLVHVLRGLATLVLDHRTDLAARDRAAAV